VKIGGHLFGTDLHPVTISSLGHFGAIGAGATALGGVTVKTDVRNARILAGYDVNLTPLNPDASGC